jgi:hypothetical protein
MIYEASLLAFGSLALERGVITQSYSGQASSTFGRACTEMVR